MDKSIEETSQSCPENSSPELHLEERCNRLLRTLAQCKPRFRVSCTLCDNMTPSDHRTTHLVHFLRHHTTESDDKDQLFAFVGISDSDTYNRSWQQGRNKIAKRKAAMEKNNRLKSAPNCKRENDSQPETYGEKRVPQNPHQTLQVLEKPNPPKQREPKGHQAAHTSLENTFTDHLIDLSNTQHESAMAYPTASSENKSQTQDIHPKENVSSNNHDILHFHLDNLAVQNTAIEIEVSTQQIQREPPLETNSTAIGQTNSENSNLIRLLSSKPNEATFISPSTTDSITNQPLQVAPIKRKRGRPRKYFPAPTTSSSDPNGAPVFKRKRGRPRKYPLDLVKRPGESSNNSSNVTIEYTQGEPVIRRKRGRPPKNKSSGNLLPNNKSPHVQSSSSKEPGTQTRFMSEKARELFLQQCKMSFHSDQTKKKIRLEEKKRRLNILLCMEKKLQSQLASQLDSNLNSDDDDSESSYSSSDEDVSTTSESYSSITFNRIKPSTKPTSTSSLELVPTTLPGIFFTNPNISIEIIPATKSHGSSVRRHS